MKPRNAVRRDGRSPCLQDRARCWQIGSHEWGYCCEHANDAAIKITHTALDLGINLIDSAAIYDFGQSKRSFVRWPSSAGCEPRMP